MNSVECFSKRISVIQTQKSDKALTFRNISTRGDVWCGVVDDNYEDEIMCFKIINIKDNDLFYDRFMPIIVVLLKLKILSQKQKFMRFKSTF